MNYTPASEYRRRARAALDENLFGNTWLYMLVVLLLTGAILSLVSWTFVGALLLVGPIYVGLSS